MGKYDETDLRITEDGDLVIENGDLALVSGPEATAQNVMCRLKSADPEWYLEQIGANLEDLLGMPNTPETAAYGEELIRRALFADDLISPEDLYVQAVPIDRQTLLFFVFFKPPNATEPLGFEVQVNLSAGATIRRMA